MSRQHVYPKGDSVGHDLGGDDCVCGPDTEFVDGGAVIVHHSLDGRETPAPVLTNAETPRQDPAAVAASKPEKVGL